MNSKRALRSGVIAAGLAVSVVVKSVTGVLVAAGAGGWGAGCGTGGEAGGRGCAGGLVTSSAVAARQLLRSELSLTLLRASAQTSSV